MCDGGICVPARMAGVHERSHDQLFCGQRGWDWMSRDGIGGRAQAGGGAAACIAAEDAAGGAAGGRAAGAGRNSRRRASGDDPGCAISRPAMTTQTGQVIAACPQCGALNRLSALRLAEDAGGVCGRCRARLFTGAPVTLSAANFARFADQSDLPLLIDFWAGWCAPCRRMAPQFEAAAGLLEPQVRLAKLDTDAEPDLARRFSIRSIPTLVLIRRGREIARTSGALQAEAIRAFAQQALATVHP